MDKKTFSSSELNENAPALELQNAVRILSEIIDALILSDDGNRTTLEWDSADITDGLTLSHDGKRVTLSEGDGLSIRAKEALSAVNLCTVCWEMTLMQTKGNVSLFMGYIDGDHVADFDGDSCIGENAHEVAYWVNNCAYPKVMTNGKITALHEKWEFDPKVGDNFRLEFDFNQKECNAFYNGELMGSITTTLPTQIYLAASIYYKGSSYETTLFEVSHRVDKSAENFY